MHTVTEPTTITPETTINAIVANYPHTLPVLQQFGLDTCCGGALHLKTAAEHHGLDLTQVLAALRAAVQETGR